uniref:Uncharacterized protein LOC111132993 isoform X2 n=1 Tax=Crassostrea virginica TaxID=6565 RepID=A0A8B8E9B0_CRAVI|nr:uncharacterized protein LOC111132993 isoform X2 [Crassostrea virginica]
MLDCKLFPKFLSLLMCFQTLQHATAQLPLRVNSLMKYSKGSGGGFQRLQHVRALFPFTVNPVVKDGKRSGEGMGTPFPMCTITPYVTTLSTVITPKTPPTLSPGEMTDCQDSPTANCSLYNSAIICDSEGMYYLWARKNCPLHCGFCHKTTIRINPTTESTSADPIQVCKDNLDCRPYNASLICSKTSIYYPWSRKHCPSFCGYCQAPTRIVPCRDRMTNCDEYSFDVCVNPLYRLWREDNCRKYCGICSGFQVLQHSKAVFPFKVNSVKKNGKLSGDGFQVLQRVRALFPFTVNPVVKDGKRSGEGMSTPFTTPYVSTTIRPQTPPTLSPGEMATVCQDSPSANCSLYNSDIICDSQGVYYLWARKNCPLHCGFCQKVCKDDPSSNCRLYNAVTLCDPNGSFYQWASAKCPNYCGLCQETTTPKPTTDSTTAEILGVCKDSLDCRPYNASLICSKTSIYYPWSRKHCPSFCGFCQAPTRIVPCRDQLTNCDEYSLDVCINPLYRLWREDNCRKYCGICSGIDVVIDYSSVLG